MSFVPRRLATPTCTAWTIVRQEIVRLDAWPLATTSSESAASYNRYAEM